MFIFKYLQLVIVLGCAIFPFMAKGEQTPRWVSKGVEELEKKRTNNTYNFITVKTTDNNRINYEIEPHRALVHHIDSVYNEGKGSVFLDSLSSSSGQPVTYILSFNNNDKPGVVYARLVDSFSRFEEYADGYYEYNTWQLYAISEPDVTPRFDNFTLSTNYGGAPVGMSLIPGLGQIYKGQKAKGYSIMGAEALLIAGVIYCTPHFNHYINLAHENPELYNEYRSKATTYQQLRLFCAITGVGLYIYNLLDAAFYKGARYVEIKRENSPSMELTFSPLLSPEMAGLGFNLKF